MVNPVVPICRDGACAERTRTVSLQLSPPIRMIDKGLLYFGSLLPARSLDAQSTRGP